MITFGVDEPIESHDRKVGQVDKGGVVAVESVKKIENFNTALFIIPKNVLVPSWQNKNYQLKKIILESEDGSGIMNHVS